MFFLNPDDLTGLDIANGQCYNQSIPQNLTFSYQGLPLGLSSTTSVNGSANHTSTAGGMYNKERASAQSLLALVAALFAATCLFL